jgi:hypothetical protein
MVISKHMRLLLGLLTILERVVIACTERGGSPTVRFVITQILRVPRETLLRRGATVELRPDVLTPVEEGIDYPVAERRLSLL